nr:MAG TPA: hypothetical protein [Bacteriophage sp.]
MFHPRLANSALRFGYILTPPFLNISYRQFVISYHLMYTL